MTTHRQRSEIQSQPFAAGKRRARARYRLAAIGTAAVIATLAVAPAYAGTSGGPKAAATSAARWGGGAQPGPTPDASFPLLGTTLADWTQRFWIRSMSIPLKVNPVSDTTGVQCGISQSGPVWFLGAPAGTALDLTCTIPAGKVILAPAATYLNDYPCSGDPTFEPSPGQTLEAFLSAVAAFVADSYTATATLDGRALTLRRINSGLFAFTGATDLSTIDACVTGSPQLAVADGWYAFIGPLARGKHILLIQSSSTLFATPTNNRITLVVQ